MVPVNSHFDTLRGPRGYDSDFLFAVSPPCPHPDRLVVLLQGQRGRLSSQPALDYRGEVEEMEEGDAEGEGPMVVREGPSGHGLPPNASSNTTTTNNLLASVKEQVGGRRCCSHTLVVVCALFSHLLVIYSPIHSLFNPTSFMAAFTLTTLLLPHVHRPNIVSSLHSSNFRSCVCS